MTKEEMFAMTKEEMFAMTKEEMFAMTASVSLRGHAVPEAIPEIASSLTLLAMTEKGNAPCNDERGNVRNDERGNVRNDERGNVRNDERGNAPRNDGKGSENGKGWLS